VDATTPGGRGQACNSTAEAEALVGWGDASGNEVVPHFIYGGATW
jgi:hypothetical protein